MANEPVGHAINARVARVAIFKNKEIHTSILRRKSMLWPLRQEMRARPLTLARLVVVKQWQKRTRAIQSRMIQIPTRRDLWLNMDKIETLWWPILDHWLELAGHRPS